MCALFLQPGTAGPNNTPSLRAAHSSLFAWVCTSCCYVAGCTGLDYFAAQERLATDVGSQRAPIGSERILRVYLPTVHSLTSITTHGGAVLGR